MQYTEAVARSSVKMVLLEISQNSQENTYARVSLLTKLHALGLRLATLLKKRLWHRCVPVNFANFPTQVFPCEMRKIFKNTFSTEHLQWLLLLKETPTQVFTCEICEIFKNTFFYWIPPVAASEWELLSSKTA